MHFYEISPPSFSVLTSLALFLSLSLTLSSHLFPFSPPTLALVFLSHSFQPSLFFSLFLSLLPSLSSSGPRFVTVSGWLRLDRSVLQGRLVGSPPNFFLLSIEPDIRSNLVSVSVRRPAVCTRNNDNVRPPFFPPAWPTFQPLASMPPPAASSLPRR